MEQRSERLPHVGQRRLGPAGNADGGVARACRHRVALRVAGGIVRIVVDFDQRDDRAAVPVLNHEVDDLLREAVAVGVGGPAAEAAWNLQQRAHRHLGVDAVRRQDALDRGEHRQLAVCEEALCDRGGWPAEPERVLQQAEQREAQRRLNSELRATRALLAESSRIAERMRIARDLHDLIGHHLTALSLNLEVASHLTNEAAGAHVRKAQSTARLLLADVREVVSELRQDDAIDLTQALRSLTEGVPGLNVHVVMPPRFSVEDPRRALVLLRCAQEIITNTAKHAGARNLWLNFAYAGESLLGLHARDDGRGAEQVEPGNGLSGMRERLAEFGGSVTLDTALSQGFALTVRLPLGEHTALAHAPTRFEPPALSVS